MNYLNTKLRFLQKFKLRPNSEIKSVDIVVEQLQNNYQEDA
jgi:hypothetical protein